MKQLLERYGVPLLALGASGLLLKVTHDHIPIQHWLFWVYARLWLLVASWGVASLAAGDWLLRRVFRSRWPLRERLLIGFACGVLVFALGMFLLGLAGLLNQVTFVLWPLAMTLVGTPGLVRTARKLAPHLKGKRWRPMGLGGRLIFAFGVLGIVAIYLVILTPANVAYDARWYHLGIAEHYVAAGAVTRFPEGWFLGTYPHLASLLYTWAFLLPDGSQFQRIELAAHIEFLLFLVTLAGIPLLARWALRGAHARLAWAAVFLFPGIFVYDSVLSVAADHVLAFWAVPLWLVFRRAWRALDPASLALFGALGGAAALTKYQAIYFLAGTGLALAARYLFFLVRGSHRKTASLGAAASAATFLAVTSIHWLKNLLWYGSPLYPLGQSYFDMRPWHSHVDLDIAIRPPGWKAQGTFWEKAQQSAEAMFTFPFTAHDWWNFHRDVPVFGFLFILCLPLLLVIRPRARLLGVAAASLIGVFIWYWTFHLIRYLQALLPWMAAFVAAALTQAWRLTGSLGRLALALLVGLQLVWGGDGYFLPAHAITHKAPIKMTTDLLASTFHGHYERRFKEHIDFLDVAEAIPDGARVLLHERHMRLGLGAEVVTDAPGTQAKIFYSTARSPREVWKMLREVSVTHVLWSVRPRDWHSWAEDLVFTHFVKRDVGDAERFGAWRLAELPKQPPPDEPYGPVAIARCGSTQLVSLEELEAALDTSSSASPQDDLREASFALVPRSCRSRDAELARSFTRVRTRDDYEIWIRRR